MFTNEQIEWYNKYEAVRISGVTNMFDRKTVCELSGLSEDAYMFVLRNYQELNSYSRSL